MADLFENPAVPKGFASLPFSAPERGLIAPFFESMGFTKIARQCSKGAIGTSVHEKPVSIFLRAGDKVRIEMNDKQGRSVFGAIDQKVVAAKI